MTRLLKAGVMVLGAAAVLLLAGGFPLIGAPMVYKSGAMLLLGMVAALLSLWGAFSLARGRWVQLLFGMLFLFFAVAGVCVCWQFAGQGIKFAVQGGPMWMGAIGMFCTALTGLVFTAVFGYLTTRVMNLRHLWLAGLHLCLALLAIGAYIDFMYEERTTLLLPADGSVTATSVRTATGEILPLNFSLRVDSFSVSRYDNETYTMHTLNAAHPVKPQTVEKQGDKLILGEESWNVADLKQGPGAESPYLLLPGKPDRVIVQNPPAVRDYCATCRIETDHRGRAEVRQEELRVNEPISCKGWIISLMNYRQMGTRHTMVQMQARRAPGRFASLVGMVGIIICTACWCWWKEKEEAA